MLTAKERRTDAQAKWEIPREREIGDAVGAGFLEAVKLGWGFEGCLRVCEAKNTGESV